MHCNYMSDIAHVHFVRILFPQNQPNEERVLSVLVHSPPQQTRQRKTRHAPQATHNENLKSPPVAI